MLLEWILQQSQIRNKHNSSALLVTVLWTSLCISLCFILLVQHFSEVGVIKLEVVFSPLSFESTSICVHCSNSVCPGKCNNILIIESLWMENFAQVWASLVSIWKTSYLTFNRLICRCCILSSETSWDLWSSLFISNEKRKLDPSEKVILMYKTRV